MMCSKSLLTYFAMGSFFLAGGIEYSVIFPTMFDYVTKRGGKEWLYGLSLSAFSISNLVTAPLYGLLFDRTHKTKFIVLLANLFEIGGNFMYFAASSKYMILGSRFIVGMGAGAGATIIGELARISEIKARTAVFSVFMGVRQIGLVIGPAFNLFLSKLNFNIGPFQVNRLTSPGAFMVIVWIIIEVIFLFFFFSLPSIATPSIVTQTTKPFAPKETTPLVAEVTPVQHAINDATHSQSHHCKPETISWSIQGWYLIREEIVVLLAILFVTMFNQTAMEAVCVPMAQDLLKWDEGEISGFYSVSGVVVIVAFVLVTVLSRALEDRWLIIGGLLCGLIGYVWMIALVAQATHDTPWIFWRFGIGAFFIIFSLPFLLVPGISLYSKLLPAAMQGFAHGIRRSTFSLSAILGPLWAGGSGVKGALFSDYYVLLGVSCGLVTFVLVMMILSFSRLSRPKSR